MLIRVLRGSLFSTPVGAGFGKLRQKDKEDAQSEKKGKKKEALLTPKEKKEKELAQIEKMVKEEEKKLDKAKEKELANQKRFELSFQSQAAAFKKRDARPPPPAPVKYNPFQAITLMKLHSTAAFDESVDVEIRTSANPKYGDQIIRGTARMPGGLGKQIDFAVICPDTFQPQLRALGVALIDQAEIIKQIRAEKVTFSRLITTPAYLSQLKRFAKFLGPKKLMPNPKDGTLVQQEQLIASVKQLKQGQMYFKLDKEGFIKGAIGKTSFSQDQLIANLDSLLQTISIKRPASLKGKLILGARLKSTMGPSWMLNEEELDFKSKRYILTGNE